MGSYTTERLSGFKIRLIKKITKCYLRQRILTKMNTSKVWESSFNSTICSMHFSPSFFNENWPNLTSVTRAEGNLIRSFINWYIIINNDRLLHAIDVHEDAVDSRLIGFFCAQEIIDLFREFTHCTHDCKKVAVT